MKRNADTREPPLDAAAQLRRGRLRILLGAAPGSGKTFAMLREGAERRRQGEDVVIGFVEPHGRPRTTAAIGSLEVVPRLVIEYQGRTLEDMDVDAVIARRPQVALIDELAHTNVPGMRHDKRWKDVEEVRDHGIDVITTVNVQHVESIKDLVEHIAGVPVRETVPDRIVDRADEIQFIDISPDALRKRMRHGNVYPLDRIDTALANFFRPGNLTALRELALRLVAQTMGATRVGVKPPPEDVLVAVSGAETSEALIRRGARLARQTDAVCTVLTVAPAADGDARAPAPWKAVAEQVGAQVVDRTGSDVVTVIEKVAREHLVHHVVLGESPPTGGLARWRPTLADRVIGRLPDVDVHVLSRHAAPRAQQQPPVELRRPDPEALLRQLEPLAGRRGTLRVYLGYARGCGATMAMLDEARRRASRGTDVVVAAVRTYGRGPCDAAVSDLDLLGGPNGPAVTGRVDVDALLARNPQVACIDELSAMTSDRGPVVDAIPRILGAGITLIGTLHLTDLRTIVEGFGQVLQRDPARPVVDDGVLRLVDEVELVDVTPSALDERLRRGDILPLSSVARALQGEFRPALLEPLREAAFRVIAEHTDRHLVAYMRERGIERPWEARSRVLACVPPRPGMERLIERAARLAAVKDAEFKAATVRTRRRSDEEKQLIGGYAGLTHRLGGEFVTLTGKSVADEIAEYARANLVNEIVMMRAPRRRLRLSTVAEVVRIMSDVDIHVLAEQPA